MQMELYINGEKVDAPRVEASWHKDMGAVANSLDPSPLDRLVVNGNTYKIYSTWETYGDGVLVRYFATWAGVFRLELNYGDSD